MWITKAKAKTQIEVSKLVFEEFLTTSGFEDGILEKIYPYSKICIKEEDGKRVDIWQWEVEGEAFTFTKTDPPIPEFGIRVRLKISYIPEGGWRDWWVVDYTIYP